MKTISSASETTYERAKIKVQALKGFYTHFAIYLIFVVFFIFLRAGNNAFH